jgi:molecular chaperone GrpE
MNPSESTSQANSADKNAPPADTSANPTAEVAVTLEEQLQQAIAERDANLERWQRTQAEFENYRKRSQKEQEQERLYRNLGLVREILPVLDNLQRAVQAAKGTRDVEQLLQGVQMVVQQFTDALARNSIVAIQATGQPFDPNLHEAIQQLPSADHPPMTVLQEVEQGYQLHDRVVRPTKVIVSMAPPGQTQPK